jgi:hypothetical protein
MAVKVKEFKDDAIIDIQVNKNIYYLLKGSLYYLFKQRTDPEKQEEFLKKMTSTKYEDMDEYEQAFFGLTLVLTEIERVASEKKLYQEREILEPGDEGYVPPTQG